MKTKQQKTLWFVLKANLSKNTSSILPDTKKFTLSSAFSKKTLLLYLTHKLFLTSINYSTPSKYINSQTHEITYSWALINDIINTIPPKHKIEAIKLEKRRRIQTYLLLNRQISTTLPATFFTFDIMQLFAKYFRLKTDSLITQNTLFLLFLTFQKEVKNLIIEFLKEPLIIRQFYLTCKSNFFVKKITKSYLKLKNFSYQIVNQFLQRYPHSNNSLHFTDNSLLCFKKLAQTGFEKYHTPLISPEIFFLTIVDNLACQKNLYLLNNFSTPFTLSLVRYQLLKSIYLHESMIRNKIPKSLHIFMYLLHLELPKKHIQTLFKTDAINRIILIFRNKMLLQLLLLNVYKNYKQENNIISINMKERKFFH
jgi:hypothetical protein